MLRGRRLLIFFFFVFHIYLFRKRFSIILKVSLLLFLNYIIQDSIMFLLLLLMNRVQLILSLILFQLRRFKISLNYLRTYFLSSRNLDLLLFSKESLHISSKPALFESVRFNFLLLLQIFIESFRTYR